MIEPQQKSKWRAAALTESNLTNAKESQLRFERK
jgi:hypothetical protein